MCNILVLLIVSSYLVQQEMCELCFKQEQTLKYFYPESKGFNITVKSENREESRLKITCILCRYFLLYTSILYVTLDHFLDQPIKSFDSLN